MDCLPAVFPYQIVFFQREEFLCAVRISNVCQNTAVFDIGIILCPMQNGFHLYLRHGSIRVCLGVHGFFLFCRRRRSVMFRKDRCRCFFMYRFTLRFDGNDLIPVSCTARSQQQRTQRTVTDGSLIPHFSVPPPSRYCGSFSFPGPQPPRMPQFRFRTSAYSLSCPV